MTTPRKHTILGIGLFTVLLIGAALMTQCDSSALPTAPETGAVSTLDRNPRSLAPAPKSGDTAPPQPERNRPPFEIRILGDAGAAVEGAHAFIVEGSTRSLSTREAIARSDGNGIMDLGAHGRVEPRRVLAVAATGYRSRRIGTIGSIAHGTAVRLERVARIGVRLMEGTRPVPGCIVALSHRELPQTAGEPASLEGLQITGPDAPVSTARTDRDGTAWLDVPERGLCFVAPLLTDHVCVDGMPIRRRFEQDGEVVELQVRRIYGCRLRIEGDDLLSWSYRLPAGLERSPATAPFLHDTERRLRTAGDDAAAILCSLREPLPAKEAMDSPREMELTCWTARHGRIDASAALRWIGNGISTVTIDVDDHPLTAHGTVVLTFHLEGHGVLNDMELPLQLLTLEGNDAAGSIALTRFDRVLPAGRYSVGHRHDSVLADAVAEQDAAFEVRHQEPTHHNVGLHYLPRHVQIRLRSKDDVEVRGAACTFVRDESCQQPGPRRVRRIHPDLTASVFWLPPGEWQLEVRPFDGAGPVTRVFSLPALDRQEAFVVE